MRISLVGLNRADVLRVLYNASRPQGLGFLQYESKPMTREEAEALLEKSKYFDYVKGRVLKVNLSTDELDPLLYDRDNGVGAAERAITILRETGITESSSIEEMHRESTLQSVQETREVMSQTTSLKHHGNSVVMHLGLEDVAKPLGEAVDKVVKEVVKEVDG